MIERMTDIHPAPHANYGVALVSILIIAHILFNPAYRSILMDILKKNLIWIAGLSFVLALNASAYAANVCAPVNGFQAGWENGGIATGATKEATCSQVKRWNVAWVANPSENSCVYTENGTKYYVQLAVVAFCPYGGTAPNCACPDPCAQKSGQDVDDGSLDFGDGANKKLFMGFDARPDENYVGQTFCSGGCLAATTKEVGSTALTMAGVRYSYFLAKFSGQSCPSGQGEATAKTKPAKVPPDSEEKKCIDKGMGYGYVNDVVKCVPKTSSDSTESKKGETVKPDGSRTVETKTDKTVCTNGVCTTTTTTITTEYNSSGTATGTTTKTETTSKPDPNATGTGSGGGGGQQGAECGISGKPPCSVKVDETGTPSDISGINGNKTALENAMDQIKDKFNEVSQPKQWSVVWNYQLPSGACSPIQFGGQRFSTSLDICKPLGYVRDLWSYVISFLTGLYIWRSCRDALNLT